MSTEVLTGYYCIHTFREPNHTHSLTALQSTIHKPNSDKNRHTSTISLALLSEPTHAMTDSVPSQGFLQPGSLSHDLT